MSTFARLRNGFALTTIVFGLAWSFGTGCTADSTDNSEPDASPEVCPTAIDGALAATCTKEGFTCPVSYPCGEFLAEQLTCKCTGGKYACVDSKGGPIAAATDVKCTNRGGGNDKQCPGDEATANGKSCTTAGLQCFYAGLTCKGESNPTTDVCQCVGAPSGSSSPLVYACEPTKACPIPADATITPPVDSGLKDAKEN